MKKAFFLDRDGVINDNPHPINRVEQFRFLPGALEAIRMIHEAGYEVFVVTNQGGVGLGFMKQAELDEIHVYMTEQIEAAGGRIREVRACTHKPKAGCVCRKPGPGMMVELIKRYHIDPGASYMVGDFYTDIQAGEAAGLQTVYIGKENLEGKSPHPDYVYSSLHEACMALVQVSGERH
ncbi:D-glycero-alpha-D-manno-heptose-1,7-bisphosphate 7-phosphatase [Aneurinibacillus uraniidurans]|uniref:D-glycero-alpha-D-manno-heptose-1,7-bisphosphate 7-phosphatase n=1 Tax=Aneurinibacillus uraniidurans TaxID=2966586 RepID=UPI00234A95C2|nr:HAD family hydrolase [Aneurinibacillus sp. B1]WCN39573.1 HAD family hydrolase [Aneurinibacillus sp. B1]